MAGYDPFRTCERLPSVKSLGVATLVAEMKMLTQASRIRILKTWVIPNIARKISSERLWRSSPSEAYRR
jgi:hypothetical protein